MRIGIIKATDFLNPIKENVDFSKCEILTPGVPPPLAWHSYAAVTNGFVHIYDPKKHDDIIYDCDLAIVTIDKRIEYLNDIFEKLISKNIPIAVGFHEGLQTVQQMAMLSKNPKYFMDLRNILAKYNIKTYINPMPKNMSKLLEIYSKTAIPNFKIYDIPSAWPIHLSDKFIISINKRKGIMIGTSGLSNFTSRNTFITLMLCAQLSKETNEPVTVIIPQEHIERHDFMAMYSKWFSPQHLNIITNKLPYLDWLKLLSLHKVSISFDLSLSQGQVSGDCALVNIPSIGGNTTIQTLVYPNLASDTTNLRKIYNTALNLLTDKYEYLITCKEIITTANATISYSAVKNNLEKMYLETIRQ